MRRKEHLVFLWLVIASCPFALAQVTTGTISGTVRDETGAVLPGVILTLKNLDTGITRSGVTQEDGLYRVPNLAVGRYEVQAELEGFRTEVRTGITLTVGREAVVDFSLKVGEITEKVVVTGEAPLIETTTSTLGGLVDEKKVRDLPLNARSLIELAPLQAGVVFAETGAQSIFQGFGRKISIGGTRFDTNLFQLDGSNINDRGGSAGSVAGILMGVETVREFNVITNAYSAEYGKHTGGIFNAVTKSGTNELHGSVFEFLRNDALDARNFFDPGDRPEYKRNQFGFAVGGPIIRNRSFAFGSYEALRERLGITSRFNVPSLDARRGFLPDRTGQLRFVGVKDTIKPFLESYPQPNSTDFGDGRAEFIRAFSQRTDEDFFTVRLDHHFSGSDSLFGRYTFDDSGRTSAANINTLNVIESRNQYLTMGETKVISPQLINKFLFTFSRSNLRTLNSPVQDTSFPLRSFTEFTALGGMEVLGGISVRGLGGWGGGGTNPRFLISNSFQYKDDLYYSRGRHSFRSGVEMERRQDNGIQGARSMGGAFSFLSIEDLLLGRPDTFESHVSGSVMRYYRATIYSFYVQDDVRFSSRVTLNLGLRYELPTAYQERYGEVSNFRKDFRKVLGLTLQDVVIGSPLFKTPSRTNFSPRIGFAWDPWGDAKTSLRGGFGVFYELLGSQHVKAAAGTMPPLRVRGEMSATRIGGLIDFPRAFFTQRTLLTETPQADPFQFEPDQPYVMKWSLDLQREIAPNMIVETGYSATTGVHLPMAANWNAPIAQGVNGRLFVPQTSPLRHPAFGRIRPLQTGAGSHYHAFRLQLSRRFADGLQFQASYTVSKALDDGSSIGSTDFSNDRGSPRYLDMRDRGLSAFDVRQNLIFNFTYDLPGRTLAGPAGKLMGGWTLSGIGRLSSGHPFDVQSGAKPAWMRFIEDFPDLAPGVSEIRIHPRDVNRYYDPGAFILPQPGVIGNLGRHTLIAPGIASFDLSVMKNFRPTERVNVQFRAEAFNLFNRANFGPPDPAVFDPRTLRVRPTAGRITRTVTSSRELQFGLKVLF